MDAFEVLYVSDHFLAVNKSAGIEVGSSVEDSGTLISLVFEEFGETGLRIVNRIDRPVSGVVLIARNKASADVLSGLFRDRQVLKEYWAIVEGSLEGEGVLENYLVRAPKVKKAFVDKNDKGKKAKLKYCVINKMDNYTMVTVQPETGRFHQIRAQFAHIGHPIKGDVKYGARRGNRDRSIHLHARSLSFEYAKGEPQLSLVANPSPGPLWSLWPQQRSTK